MNHAAIITILTVAGLAPAAINNTLAGLVAGMTLAQVETLLQANGLTPAASPAVGAQIMPHLGAAPVVPPAPPGPVTVQVPATLTVTPPTGVVNWSGGPATNQATATTATPPTTSIRPWLHTGIIAALVVLAALVLGLVLNAGHVTMFEEDRADYTALTNHTTGEVNRGTGVVNAHTTAETNRGTGVVNAHTTAETNRGTGVVNAHTTNEVGRGIVANNAARDAVLKDNRRTRGAIMAERKRRAADNGRVLEAISKDGNATRGEIKRPRRLRLDLGNALGIPSRDE